MEINSRGINWPHAQGSAGGVGKKRKCSRALKMSIKRKTGCGQAKFLTAGRLNKRIAGACGNSTLVILVPRHHDVAFHSPACSPGIFDQPVVLPFICTVSNNKNSMIELRAAAGSEIVKNWKQVRLKTEGTLGTSPCVIKSTYCQNAQTASLYLKSGQYWTWYMQLYLKTWKLMKRDVLISNSLRLYNSQ